MSKAAASAYWAGGAVFEPPNTFEVEVDGVPMSGLIAATENPRAVLLALHGGATTPEYFDAPGFPDHSLLRLATAVSTTVIAPDRPGYGASRDVLGDHVSPWRQVDLMFACVREVLREHRLEGTPLFLAGHSQGCVLAMRMAADPRGSSFLGLEIAGTGVEHHPRSLSAMKSPPQVVGRGVLRNLLWEPAHLYEGRTRVLSPAPAFDGIDASTWPIEFAELASMIAAPVRICLGDHEFWWQAPPAGLEAMASLFIRSARVVTHEQFESGHNTSLGISARAYHLSTMSFVEECLLMRDRIGTPNNGTESNNA